MMLASSPALDDEASRPQRVRQHRRRLNSCARASQPTCAMKMTKTRTVSCDTFWQQVPGRVFRYFDVRAHAEAFVAGSIFVSTLERCRRIEDPKRVDAGEATLHYSSGSHRGRG